MQVIEFKAMLQQVCESDDLPLTDASARAVPLTPKEWREKLEARQKQSDSELQNVKKVLLLDVRNSMLLLLIHPHPNVLLQFLTAFQAVQSHSHLQDSLLRTERSGCLKRDGSPFRD